MDASLEYLMSFLEEEFRAFPGVRVRAAPRAGTRRSQDLPQDYDPESSDLHARRGVMVQALGREYYFPVEWVEGKRFDEIQRQATQIREHIE